MKNINQLRFIVVFLFASFFLISCDSLNIYPNTLPEASFNTEIISNHSYANLESLRTIPISAIETAKNNLHIAYGHTSHGSQITTGMTGLNNFANTGILGSNYPVNLFDWNDGGAYNSLDLHDYAMAGDCGYYPEWVDNTVTYLEDDGNSDINIIIWSWCGQVSSISEATMTTNYLEPMANLEEAYPDIIFIYMTGHLDGTGLDGTLHLRNEQIRDFCLDNNKVLYDFADIETYNPDGLYYGDKNPNDNCDYDLVDGSSGNWAIEWAGSHTEDVDWYACNSAHSHALNANMKAYAAWWLWARIAGWNGH